MTVLVDETHAVAKKILACLVKRPTRVCEVWKFAVQDSASVGKTIKVFYWLRKKGYIMKSGCGYRDPYVITDRVVLFSVSCKGPRDFHGKVMMFAWNTRSSVLLADEKGRIFQVFRVDKPEFKVRGRISPWSCWRRERLCRKKLRRPHETCFPCRLRRVVGGELPWIIPVKPYICLLSTQRGKAKKAVTKGLANAIELFSQ